MRFPIASHRAAAWHALGMLLYRLHCWCVGRALDLEFPDRTRPRP